MRTATQITETILAFVHEEPNVRVALLNGSRANPAHMPDLLSDFDLLLGVSEVAAFDGDPGWLQPFGRVRILQRPTPDAGEAVWLVVFGDGTRIDFTIVPLAHVAAAAANDSLTRVLVDKDGLLPPLPPASEAGYLVAHPTAAQFAESVNEFWWVAPYVAKGLWRGQLPYARRCFECTVRPELERLLVWHAAAEQEWRFNPGSFNKYLQPAIAPELWQAYVATFAGANGGAQWDALLAACALEQNVGAALAATLGYPWNQAEADGARELVAALRAAPRDATTLGLA